jgi:CBS domain-containing protein
VNHRATFESPFYARDLSVPIEGSLAFGPDDDSQSARRLLAERKFDQAPVLDSGRPIGFVLASHLEGHQGHIDEILRPLGSGNVVSADATVGALLEWIIEPGFLFVLEGRDITGFITIHDFNKQPARGHLYLMLARLESGLARLIRNHYVGDERAVLRHLSSDAQVRVRARFDEDQRAGVESDLVAYLDFSHLINVISEEAAIRTSVGGLSRTRWDRDTGGLVYLRNEVMHPVRNVVLTKGGLIQLHERERRIRALIELVEAAAAPELAA